LIILVYQKTILFHINLNIRKINLFFFLKFTQKNYFYFFLSDLFNKIQGGISFQTDSNDDNANLFEQVCSQRDNMCLASEQSNLILDEEIWISKEIKYSENENNTLNIRYNNNRFCILMKNFS
jgi:hypothetical protein